VCGVVCVYVCVVWYVCVWCVRCVCVFVGGDGYKCVCVWCVCMCVCVVCVCVCVCVCVLSSSDGNCLNLFVHDVNE